MLLQTSVVRCTEPTDANYGGWDVLVYLPDSTLACVAELRDYGEAVRFESVVQDVLHYLDPFIEKQDTVNPHYKDQIQDRIDSIHNDLMTLRHRIDVETSIPDHKFTVLTAGLIAIQTQLGQTTRVMNKNYDEEERVLD